MTSSPKRARLSVFIGGRVTAVTKPDKMSGAARVLSGFFGALVEETNMKHEQNFTQGPILSALLKFALPVLLALLLQAMYGAVDLQVVGNSARRQTSLPFPPEARSCRPSR